MSVERAVEKAVDSVRASGARLFGAEDLASSARHAYLAALDDAVRLCEERARHLGNCGTALKPSKEYLLIHSERSIEASHIAKAIEALRDET